MARTPLPPDADDDGVVFVHLGLQDPPRPGPRTKSPPPLPSSTATVALYAGIPIVELQAVVRAALGLPAGVNCVGFLVSHHHRGNNSGGKSGGGGGRHGRGLQTRIVPLAVACAAPTTLHSANGYVKALVSTSAAKSTAIAATAMTTTTTLPPAPSIDRGAGGRVQRLITALRDEDRSLTSFEAAVLAEICEQRSSEVLGVMLSTQPLAAKKDYLLSLIRGEPADEVRAPTSTTTTKPITSRDHRQQPAASSPVGAAGDASAQVDLICKKVVSIAHTVFSPHVQSDLMTEASLYREKHRKLTSTRGATVEAPKDVSVSNIVELLGIVERLLNKHALQEEQTVKLIRLILAENRLLFSALQSYKLDFNLNELENTIKRMAELGSNGNVGSPATGNAEDARKRSKGKSPRAGTSPRKSKHKDRKGFIVRPNDILHTLYQKKMITTLELDLLRALVHQNDSQVLAAVDEYEQSKNLKVLRDQLVAIVEEITVELGDEERAGRLSLEDPEEALMALLNNWQENLTQFVQRWFSERKLNADQVHVLRGLIEENHNLLQSAYEVFAADGDETELLDTLQRIAKLQLQAQEGALLNAFTQIVEEHCHVLRDHEKSLVKQLFARRNELVRAAWEVFEVERNVFEFGDTLLRIARFTTRQDTKIRLVEVVGEMMRRQLIRSHEADGLIRLFEEKNEAMVAANEVFESDGDVKELVETLLLIVKHANFGDPPQCSSPRHPGTGRLPHTPPSSPVVDSATLNRGPQATSSEEFDADSEEFFIARLIEILEDKGRLAKWQAQLLFGLLTRGDARLLAAMDVYNEDRDVRELVDTLWRLCDLTAWEKNKSKILRELVKPLEDAGKIVPGIIKDLADNRDDRLVAAFVVFLGDGNSDEFSDTIARLASVVAKQRGITSAAIADVSKTNSKNSVPPLSSVLEEDPHLDMHQVSGILKQLMANGEITPEYRAEIESRIKVQDPATLAAFDVYQATNDERDLADTLQRILCRGNNPTSPSSPSRANAMEKQLLHFASELSLSRSELSALKRCIARKDSIVEAAVEVYEMEMDEEDLKDTLRRIAMHLVATEEQEPGKQK